MAKHRGKNIVEQDKLTRVRRPNQAVVEAQITNAAELIRQDWQLMARGWQGAFPTVAQLREVEKRAIPLRNHSLYQIGPVAHEMRQTDKCFLVVRCRTHTPAAWARTDEEDNVEEKVLWIGETDFLKYNFMETAYSDLGEEDVCLMDRDGKLWTLRPMAMGDHWFERLIARPATDDEVIAHRGFFQVTNKEAGQLAQVWRRVFQGETTTR